MVSVKGTCELLSRNNQQQGLKEQMIFASKSWHVVAAKYRTELKGDPTNNSRLILVYSLTLINPVNIAR